MGENGGEFFGISRDFAKHWEFVHVPCCGEDLGIILVGKMGTWENVWTRIVGCGNDEM